MLASILATACCLALPTPTTAQVATKVLATAPLTGAPDQGPRDDKALKALQAWLKQYDGGKINIYSTAYLNRVPLQIDWKQQEITAKQSYAVRHGLAPKSGLADSTWLGDLEVIADAVAQLDTPEAAALLVALAAVGLDKREYSREQAPHVVRAVGEGRIAKLASPEARAEVARFARGEVKLDRSEAMPFQGAALRALAAFADPKFRSAMESALGGEDPLLRFHAAEALHRLASEESALALVSALERETTEVAMPAIVEALRAIYAGYMPKLATSAPEKSDEEPKAGQPAAAPKLPESARLVVRAAIGALGRTTWRSDMALLRLLDELRSKDAVPALIGILEQFRDNPDQLRSGKLSTLVLHRAHELLVTMTGAVYPASQPEKWREFWEQEKDRIQVEQHHEAKGGVRTAASGFCGIPVEGSRVVFILDLSRSMTFAMGRKGESSSTRIDYARRELRGAMESISENASFNLITFDGNEKAQIWKKKLVQATERNRQTFLKYVDQLEPDGGTNLWSGLEEAMKIKSLVYGDRYETSVDEIFILSDGAPSVGEVLDPIEILRLVKEANRFSKMRINTIFISSEDPEEARRQPSPWMGNVKPEDLMRRLAEENGGKCVIL